MTPAFPHRNAQLQWQLVLLGLVETLSVLDQITQKLLLLRSLQQVKTNSQRHNDNLKLDDLASTHSRNEQELHLRPVCTLWLVYETSARIVAGVRD